MVGWTMGRSSSNQKRDVQMIASLCDWFNIHKRDLPWRRRRTGYRALVAEAMLQQTQVSRVVGRFQKFIERFPTVRPLAEADEQDVLAMWQGLGYYRRAQHLQSAARMIVTQFGGRIPTTVDRLRRLPGVGRYSAAAIASIVYGKPEPMVDGNVRRVLARWEARADATGDDWAWDRAAELIESASAPGTLNESLMELGALICTPRAPRCQQCPVARHCRAFERSAQHRIPPPKKAARQKVEHHHAVVIVRGGKVLLERRASNGMWSRMWQMPTAEHWPAATARATLQAWARQQFGLSLAVPQRLGAFTHQTTHRTIRFVIWSASVNSGRLRRRPDAQRLWRRLHQLDDLPLANPQRLATAMVGELGN